MRIFCTLFAYESLETFEEDQSLRPMDDPAFTSSNMYGGAEPQQSADASPSVTNSWDPQPSDPRLNWTFDGKGRLTEKVTTDTSLPAKLGKELSQNPANLKDHTIPQFKGSKFKNPNTTNAKKGMVKKYIVL